MSNGNKNTRFVEASDYFFNIKQKSNSNKNIIFVEANVMNSFSFTPLMASEEMIFDFSPQISTSLSVVMATN